jgi:hypothetical protein
VSALAQILPLASASGAVIISVAVTSGIVLMIVLLRIDDDS